MGKGGRLLVVDSPEVENSTANALLWPFGLSDPVRQSGQRVAELSAGKAVAVEAACEVDGGETLLRLGAHPVAARAGHGAGQVMAVGFASLFQDDQMGANWMTQPDADLSARFHLLFGLVRSAATGQPVVEPAASRRESSPPKSRKIPLPAPAGQAVDRRPEMGRSGCRRTAKWHFALRASKELSS